MSRYKLHICSGLLHSGSNLLAALLQPNPCIYSGTASPLRFFCEANAKSQQRKQQTLFLFIGDKTSQEIETQTDRQKIEVSNSDYQRNIVTYCPHFCKFVQQPS